MMHTPVRAVTFDLWGTLIKNDPRFKPLRNEMIRTMFDAPVSAEEFNRIMRKEDSLANVLSVGTGIDYGFYYRVERALRVAGVDMDSNPARIDELLGRAHAEQTLLALQYPAQSINPDVMKALGELASHVPLASISNTGLPEGLLMRTTLSMSGMSKFFSVQVFSNEITRCKPWPEIFDATFTGLTGLVPDLSRNEIIHIGDNYVADVCGAKGFGMDALLVNTTGAPSITDAIHDLIQKIA